MSERYFKGRPLRELQPLSKTQFQQLKFSSWLDEVRFLAAKNIQRNDDDVFLRRWWVEKYKKSPKSQDFLEYTTAELMLEYFEDFYSQKDNKTKMFELLRKVGEEIILSDEGSHAAKWEKEIEDGKIPDLLEGLPEDVRKGFMSVDEIEELVKDVE